MLIRSNPPEDQKESSNAEWERLVRGVRNNQPAIFAEWLDVSASRKKRTFRQIFGDEGDRMRRNGWGVANIGPLTQSIIGRFMVKLGKALYYRHNDMLFDGIIYANHINIISIDKPPALMEEILRMAPDLSIPQRSKRPLTDQFIYRFNHSAEHGVMYAVVEFSEQFVFQLIVVGYEMANKLETMSQRAGSELPSVGRYPCPLKHRPMTL